MEQQVEHALVEPFPGPNLLLHHVVAVLFDIECHHWFRSPGIRLIHHYLLARQRTGRVSVLGCPQTLALAAPCPLPSRRRRRVDASCDEAIELSASYHLGASKQGEPLREGRLWRSRR